jgi:hypothetical protein
MLISGASEVFGKASPVCRLRMLKNMQALEFRGGQRPMLAKEFRKINSLSVKSCLTDAKPIH